MEAMLREIREQPAVLEAVRDVLGHRIRSALAEEGPPRRLHLVGCGDMHFAAEAARRWARLAGAAGLEAHRSMDLRWEAGGLGADDLVVAASFSGRTPRTEEAVRLARRAGARVWVITGNPGSPVANAADRVLLLPTGPREALSEHRYAGYHNNVPQTKTFTATLWAELAIALEGTGGPAGRDSFRSSLDRVPGDLANLLPALESAAETAARLLPGVASALVLASGPWLPIAWYGAAKFLEYAIPGRGQCLEEVNHLEAFVTGQGTAAIFVAPDERSITRADELIAAGFDRLGAVLAHIRPAASAKACGGSPLIPLERTGSAADLFTTSTALALLAFHVARNLGRDVDRWVGGVRTELIETQSLRATRGSRVRETFGEAPLR